MYSDHRDPSQCIKTSGRFNYKGSKKGKIIKLSNQKEVAKANFPFVNGRCLESVSIKKKEDRNPGSNPDLWYPESLPHRPDKIAEKFKYINNQTEPLN